MTVRKKLVISNIFMISVPMILAFFFAVLAFTPYGGDSYWDSIEDQMYEDENGVYSVQSIIYSYKHGTFLESSAAGNFKKNLKELEADLSYMGYHFYMSKTGKEVFSNLTLADERQISRYLEGVHDSIENLAISTDGCFIVRDIFEISGEDCEILAVHTAGCNDKKIRRSQGFDYQKYIMPAVLSFAALVIAVVAMTNAILAKWIYRMIIKPLDILKNGTKEISEGNLNYRFSYENKDEFGEVCREFENMREHLKKSVETRLKFEQYRKELIAGISHDLRTPLTSIKGYVEGLKDGIADTEEKRKRYYDAIHIRAKDMETLVNSLSEFSRLENGQYKYRMEPVDIGEYLQRLVQGYQEEARQKKAVILFEDFAEKTELMLDIQEMHRVFINLFENSIRYRTEEQSKIYVRIENKEDMLEICVADDGPGVADDKLPYIFNSFYRVDVSRTNSGSGSGLGLAIVKQIVEGHHGSIRAFNKNGLVIQMMLPLAGMEQKTGGKKR